MLKFGGEDIQNERQLSQFTMENIHEAVYWIDSGQHIIHVNEAACRLSGYSREELTHKMVTDLNPSAILVDWPAFWSRLRKEKKITFDAQHLHKEGYYYDVEVTGNYIETMEKNIPVPSFGISVRKKEKKIFCAPFQKTLRV